MSYSKSDEPYMNREKPILLLRDLPAKKEMKGNKIELSYTSGYNQALKEVGIVLLSKNIINGKD